MARWDENVALKRDEYDMSQGYGVGKVLNKVRRDNCVCTVFICMDEKNETMCLCKLFRS
jgi:hypothetical protein